MIGVGASCASTISRPTGPCMAPPVERHVLYGGSGGGDSEPTAKASKQKNGSNIMQLRVSCSHA